VTAWLGRFRGYALVLTAAALWATMGLFYKGLMADFQLAPLAIIFWRIVVASVCAWVWLGVWRRQALRLARRDWLVFVGYGALGVTAFSVIYLYAIARIGVGVAAVLMYTAPVWVTGAGVLFLREPLTARKGAALALAVTGCALVGRVYALADARFDWLGLLVGLSAGVGYGLYILFSRAVSQRGYGPAPAIAYGYGLGALCLLPWQAPAELARVITTPSLLFWLLLLGLVPTLLGGAVFNVALRTVSASNASITATVEPVIAAVLGWAVWNERLEVWQMLGAGLIVAGVVLIQWPTRPEPGDP
jgi:drug/metabolite transporter, DME family